MPDRAALNNFAREIRFTDANRNVRGFLISDLVGAAANCRGTGRALGVR
jgi:hypothetical protein